MTLKAKIKKNILEVKALMKHDMMTYDQATKKSAKLGKTIDANFIIHVQAEINGEKVYDASTSQFLSKNPIIKFKLKADAFKAGDKIILTWTDRSGKQESKKTKIKQK